MKHLLPRHLWLAPGLAAAALVTGQPDPHRPAGLLFMKLAVLGMLAFFLTGGWRAP